MTTEIMRRVTDDPELNAELFQLQDELGQTQLREHIMELGYRPPEYNEGDPIPGVFATWSDDSDFTAPGIMVWASNSDETDADDGRDQESTGWLSYNVTGGRRLVESLR